MTPIAALPPVAASVSGLPAPWLLAAGCAFALVFALRRRAGGPGRRSAVAGCAFGFAAFALTIAAAGPTRSRAARVVGEVAVVEPGDGPSPATAVETARATLPANGPHTIVLHTAGATRLTGSGAEALADALRPGGTRLVAVGARVEVPEHERTPPDTPATQRLAVRAPAVVEPGRPFEVVVHATGRAFRESPIRVRVDREVRHVLPVAGSRQVRAPLTCARRGAALVVADAPGDDTVRPGLAWTDVVAPPSLLFVDDRPPGRAPESAQWLAQGLRVRHVAPRDLDTALLEWASTVVLGPGAVPPADATDTLLTRVAAGTGLLVLGGADERGLSRLRDTAIAAALPVQIPEPPPEPDEPDEPPVPPPQPEPPPPPEPAPPATAADDDPSGEHLVLDEGQKTALRVALLLLVDRSTSMAGAKLVRAKQAAMAATRSLDPDDRVGVVAFGESFRWVVPFQDAGDRSGVLRRLARIPTHGGTDFYRALESGMRRLAAEEAGVRHAILLTDGVTADAEFQGVVERGVAAGITLTCVAIGDGADDRLLGHLAGWGRGHFYEVHDTARIPEVVTADTAKLAVQPRAERRAAVMQEMRERLRPPGVEPPAPVPAPSPEPVTDEPAAAPGPPNEERDADGSARESAPTQPPVPRVDRLVPVATHPSLDDLPRAGWPPLAHVETVALRERARVAAEWRAAGTPALVFGRYGEGRVAVLAADVAAPVEGLQSPLVAWVHGGSFLAQLARALAAPLRPPGTGRVADVVSDERGTRHVRVPGAPPGLLRMSSTDGGEFVVDLVAATGGARGTLPPAAPSGVASGLLTTDSGTRIVPVAAVVPPASSPLPGTPLAHALPPHVERLSETPEALTARGDDDVRPAALPWLLAALVAVAAGILAERLVPARGLGL